MSNSYFSFNALKHNITIKSSSKKMTPEISEIDITKSFFVMELLGFNCLGLASLVNLK